MKHFLKTTCVMLTLAGSNFLSTMAADYVPKIIAGVIQSDDWEYEKPLEGFYSLEAIPEGKLTRLSKERDIYAAPLGGAVYEDGKMYGIHYRAIDDPFTSLGYTYCAYSVAYDMKTFEKIKSQYLGDMYMNLVSTAGMTHDPVTGKNYGYFMNPNMDFEVLSRNFSTIDFTSQNTPQKTKIREFDKSETYCAMAASPDGRLFLIDHNGYLYTMNKNNGSTTLIGDVGKQDISAYPSSMTFDPRTKKLYWSYVDISKKSYLYEVTYEIGSVSATKIMQIPGNAILVNMYIAPAEAEDQAPEAVSDLSVVFEGESYTGTVSFTMPSTSYEGEALSGSLDYFILANDTQIATGKANAAEKVNAQVTVPEVQAGETVIKVYAQNEFGNGVVEEKEVYVGFDTPEAIASVALNFNNATHTATVEWTAPAKGKHGLTLTPSNIKYDVVRYPGAVKVATAQSGTSFNETLDDSKPLQSYYYEVTPINGGKFSGESTLSNKAVVGVALNPTYSEYFTSDAGFDVFTVIDANNDGAKWKRYHQVYQYSGTVANYARMEADKENTDDDWLLLPPMNLRQGSVYQLNFSAKKEYSGTNYNQLLEVAVGQGLDVENYTKVMGATQIYDVNFNDFTQEFKIDEDGIYYIGFHAISKPASGPLDIDYVVLKELASGEGPKAVSDLKIIPDATGALSAVASFTAPAENLRGESLSSISKVTVVDANGTIVGESTAVEPGKAATINLAVKINGRNTFTLTPYTGTNTGEPASISVFVGEDTPLPPTNIKLQDNGEYAVLSWDAPSVGVNGEFVNPETMKFNLGDIDDIWGYFIPLVDDIKSPYNTGVKSNEGDQTLLYYALRGETRAGNGEPGASNGLVVGKPYDAPYALNFAKDFDANSFVWYEGEKADWNMGRTNDISSDGDGYAFLFTPNMAETGIFNLGKINLANTVNPALTFDYYVFPNSSTSISVAVDVFPQGKAETLKTLSYYNESEEGWKHASVDLSKYKDEKFVIIKFAMSASSKATPAVIDNIKVDVAASINSISVDQLNSPFTVYSTDGRLIGKDLESLEGILPGIYIVNGNKVVLKK